MAAKFTYRIAFSMLISILVIMILLHNKVFLQEIFARCNYNVLIICKFAAAPNPH